MNKNVLEKINENDSQIKKEFDHVNVDLTVQEFDEDYSHIENIEDFDEKTIKYLERMIRGSYEYKEYIKYLKNELDIKKCVLTPGLDLENVQFQLEFHHYPLSLFEIVDIVGNSLLKKNNSSSVSMFDIMEQVMKEHYEGHVGLVPLSSTVHEMFHNGAIEIPIESVYGDYKQFCKKYNNSLTPEINEKLIMASSIHSEDAKSFNQKLKKNILNYSVSYSYQKEQD